MPIYSFRNKNTDEEIDVYCKFEEVEEILKELGDDWVRSFRINIVSGVGSVLSKTDEGWKDRLRAIKKANPGSTINV